MRVHEIMTKRVQTVPHTESAEAAWNLMRWKRIHHLVVTGASGEVVGVVSARDLGGSDRDEIRRMRPIRAMMTAYAVKATPDMPVRQAANVMRGWNIGCLPVIESDGTLAGIVTVSDLLRLLAEQVSAPARARQTKHARQTKKVAKSGRSAKGSAKKSRSKRG
jgi:CBS domain-containing protein